MPVQEPSFEHKTNAAWQSILVWLMFLASIVTLFVNSVTAFLLPGQELAIRERLRKASIELAGSALNVTTQLHSDASKKIPKEINQRLEEVSNDILKYYSGVEGGFFIINGHEEFAGYAFPTERIRGPKHDARREPPPKEEPYIRLQAKQTAAQDESTPLIQVRDVGPSRVVVATAPVGSDRPSRMIVWLMYRLTGPEQHRQQVYRYQISTFLALGGLIGSLLLTLRLRTNLIKERQSRERLREELRRSEHLASLGLLVAQVAHEIRNPLAGIRSTVQLWQRIPQTSQTPESMQAVVAAVDRLDELLSNLLHFSRSETSDRSEADLNAIVRETTELLRAQAVEQHVLVELDLNSQLPKIPGSTTALRQVVLNLATNALQAMPESGQLTCRTRWKPGEKDVELEIADTGPGVDPTVRARLFEPFFTTRAQGTGLGLALCREIILQHHGRIDLQAHEPRGTLCRIALPISGHP